MDDRRAEQLRARVAEVSERVAAAARRSGRSPADVTIVAAAKTRSAAEVEVVLAAGIEELGYNYVQEAAAVKNLVGHPATWRLIGHLQRNKVGPAVRLFDTIDTVDTARLAAALQRRVEETERPSLPILLQIRLGDEATKSGAPPAEAESLLGELQQMPRLLCHGLMTMPPPGSADDSRRWFAHLRELAERLRPACGLRLPVLSMGLSADYEVAIEEGATHVRLGTALFGSRPG